MAHPLLLALFDGVTAAAGAARELHALGVGPADLSVVSRDHASESSIARQIDGSPGSELVDSNTASKLGELSGYVLAAIAIGLPGTGALVAAGPLAAELGETAGHLAGSLKATLVSAGLADSEAEEWVARVHSGEAILLGAHARIAASQQVESAMRRYSSGRVVATEWHD